MNQLEKLMQISNTLNKKLSIIIVNYKSKNFLEKCVASAYEKINPNISFEIIIVNNDKEENLDFILEKYSEIKIVNQKENAGFGAGNNAGFKNSRGEIVFFLNPDSEIISNNISEVIEQFSLNEKVGVLGSCLITLSGKIQKWSAGAEVSLFSLVLNNLRFLKSKKVWENKKITSTDWVSGAAMLIKRDVFSKVGGFDENFFMYFEDMDLCRRVRKLDKKVIYFPKFKVRHKNGESYSCLKKQKKDYYDSQEKYFKKHYGKFQFELITVLRKIKLF